MTALGAATSQNLAAVFGGHAGAEAVFVDATTAAGLISTFHDRTLSWR